MPIPKANGPQPLWKTLLWVALSLGIIGIALISIALGIKI